MGLLYSESYQVPFYETDVNHYMKLPHLLSLALQVSGKHSMTLGVGDDVIFEQYGLVWVITDYHLDIIRLPRYAEKIRIETEATAYNRLFCYRNFYIYGEDGTKIITILSTFVLMDFETRKVHPVIENIVSVYKSDKVKKVIHGPRYKPLETPEDRLYHVRYFDLDMNGHVNNSKYLEWMFEAIDFSFLKGHIPKTIDLKYIKEIHYGSDIVSSIETNKNITKHEISVDGVVHARSIIEWQEKE
ncbi:acyl-ACP thioesterase domain-containing protein [Streptococcus sciuri]|uniref:Thioesterase n=1 Tax=Streptococcus sciuri TaxID=2973939 RepID=A0ABT2F609_9STRE|nr:acyl-ACP thioesterase domain-containing protein [Streptococcus sciuri]MCS4487466.1 thioesterase [Streptococcus sciuri]